jgi:hypothetical protein
MKFKEIFLTVVLRYPINRDTLGNHGIYASSILFPLFFFNRGDVCIFLEKGKKAQIIVIKQRRRKKKVSDSHIDN